MSSVVFLGKYRRVLGDTDILQFLLFSDSLSPIKTQHKHSRVLPSTPG